MCVVLQVCELTRDKVLPGCCVSSCYRMRRFESGVLVVQSLTHDEASIITHTLELVRYRCSMYIQYLLLCVCVWLCVCVSSWRGRVILVLRTCHDWPKSLSLLPLRGKVFANSQYSQHTLSLFVLHKLQCVSFYVLVSPSTLLSRLLITEKAGKACRDDSVEGLHFYPNRFLTEVS